MSPQMDAILVAERGEDALGNGVGDGEGAGNRGEEQQDGATVLWVVG
jgi:hypothetical protein